MPPDDQQRIISRRLFPRLRGLGPQPPRRSTVAPAGWCILGLYALGLAALCGWAFR